MKTAEDSEDVIIFSFWGLRWVASSAKKVLRECKGRKRGVDVHNVNISMWERERARQ